MPKVLAIVINVVRYGMLSGFAFYCILLMCRRYLISGIVNNKKGVIIKCARKKRGETNVEGYASLLQWPTVVVLLPLILSSFT